MSGFQGSWIAGGEERFNNKYFKLLANSSLGWSQVDNTPGPCNDGSSTTTSPSSTVRSKKLGTRPLSSPMSSNKPLSPSKKSRRRRQAAITTSTTTATSTTTTTSTSTTTTTTTTSFKGQGSLS